MTLRKKILFFTLIFVVAGAAVAGFYFLMGGEIAPIGNEDGVILPAISTSTGGVSTTSSSSATSIKPSGPVATSTFTSPAEVLPVGTDRFVVPLNASSTLVIDALFDQGFISDKAVFAAAYASLAKSTSTPGAYKLSKDMTPKQIAAVLHGKPYMKWIVIPEGLRKEEIAALLAKELGWSSAERQKWITTYTALKFDYVEGVYFPDTYLIPVDESALDVANRIVAKFNEKFAPYIPRFNAENIKWTTGLTLASIVQREAANDAEMPLIAGILWNRLDQNIALGVDATLQYIRGDVGKGWWAPITVADKELDSPYNTYKNKGLPPHPISNPGLPAIDAALNPAKIDCLYYLHDKDRVIHCAATYEEHQANIEKYLK